MSRNLADPAYEPTDNELAALARAAGSDARTRAVRAQRELREQIAQERMAAVAKFRDP